MEFLEFECPAWTWAPEWMRTKPEFQKCYQKSYESYTKVWMSVYADMYLTPGPSDKMVLADFKSEDALSSALHESADQLTSVEQQADHCAYHQARAEMRTYHQQAHEIAVLMVKLQSQFLPRHAGTTVVQQSI
jgi:hypothetical protein